MDTKAGKIKKKTDDNKRKLINLDMTNQEQLTNRLQCIKKWSGDKTRSETIRRLINTEYIKMKQSGIAEQ